MSIRERLFAVITLLNVVVILCGGMGGLGLSLSNSALKTVFLDRVVPMQQLKEVSDRYAIEISESLHKLELGGSAVGETRSRIEQARAAGHEKWEAYSATFLTPEEATLVKEAKVLLQQADAAIDQVLKAKDSAGAESKDQTLQSAQTVDVALSALTEKLHELVALQMDVSKQEFESSQRRFELVMVALVVLTLLSAAGGALAGRSLRNAVNEMLALISENLEEVASGNVKANLSEVILRRTDELGTISASLQTVRVSIRDIIQKLHHEADGLAAASDELTATSKELSRNTEGIHASLSEVSSSGGQLSSAVSTLAGQANQISAQGQTVASAVEEMSASITEVSRNTSRESVIARQADEKTQETRKLMERLQEAASEVGKIVGVISDVARQTNLLALNAAIEAASAGPAGRGFAVVANEVKELAKESAAAAERISGQIEHMRNATHEAMSGIQTLTGVNQEVSAIAQAIAAAVEEQTVTVHEISRSMLSQTQAITHISAEIQTVAGSAGSVSRTIGVVSKEAESVASAATETSVSARELAGMAAQLRTLVQRFTI